MSDFRPSDRFVTRVMNDVRTYEMGINSKSRDVSTFVLSIPAFSILSAGGILLGIFNLIRMALILLSPVLCQ
jgi:hypothetical protein